jgi:excisionase family DNA binding protein
MTGDRQYLRATEVAALTGMSIRTVRRWIREKTLPSTKLGGARLVAIADLKAMLSAPHDRSQEAYDDREESSAESEA